MSEGYYNQGVLSEEIKGAVTIYFDGEYDLHGMTILFGECYPTEFVVQTAEGETHYSNTAQEWVTSDVFQSVSWVRIVPSSMVNGNGRLRILKFTCGTSLTIPVNKIQNYSMTDVVSPVTESLPTQDMKLLSVKQDLIALEHKIRETEKSMKDADEESLAGIMEEYSQLTHRFEASGGYIYKSELIGVLKGLGFTEEEFDKKTSALSGGQKTLCDDDISVFLVAFIIHAFVFFLAQRYNRVVNSMFGVLNKSQTFLILASQRGL